ncbi:hypothetical protein HMPREF0645_2014 [Hallella bergensis DSM 17361]|uniref:Uncharacterized protein n=1 Tax=Hallella bergensis DSM 17361 TaxID=585502 RepID=D1PYH9_9BACT|nr:hypothetical protein HMPREF0645_2014 [Hallella bergensis DSM 17361]
MFDCHFFFILKLSIDPCCNDAKISNLWDNMESALLFFVIFAQ